MPAVVEKSADAEDVSPHDEQVNKLEKILSSART